VREINAPAPKFNRIRCGGQVDEFFQAMSNLLHVRSSCLALRHGRTRSPTRRARQC